MGRIRNERVLLGTQGCRQMLVKDWGVRGEDVHNSLPDKTAKQFTNTLAWAPHQTTFGWTCRSLSTPMVKNFKVWFLNESSHSKQKQSIYLCCLPVIWAHISIHFEAESRKQQPCGAFPKGTATGAGPHFLGTANSGHPRWMTAPGTFSSGERPPHPTAVRAVGLKATWRRWLIPFIPENVQRTCPAGQNPCPTAYTPTCTYCQEH